MEAVGSRFTGLTPAVKRLMNERLICIGVWKKGIFLIAGDQVLRGSNRVLLEPNWVNFSNTTKGG